MSDPARDYLRRQFKTAWTLTELHLAGLDTEECLWRPAAQGMHVHRAPDGTWRADWPEHERYDLGPPSIAWITWHIGFWWSMVLDHSFGEGKLAREAVTWPGTADGVREWLGTLRNEWRRELDSSPTATCNPRSVPAGRSATDRSATWSRGSMSS